MAFKQEPYEISLWKGQGADEVKFAAIGGLGFNSPIHAYEIGLKENINGEKTLSFKMNRKYINDKGESVFNPFVNELAAEAIIKLKCDENSKDDPWTDFVIKEIKESEDKQSAEYTCKEVYVNELGKNGYTVILDTELGNNYGTVRDLASAVLENSGWTYGEDSDIDYEDSAQVLFELSNPGSYTLTPVPIEGRTGTVTPTKPIYFFYDDLTYDDLTGNYTVDPSKAVDGKIQCFYTGAALDQYDDTDDNGVIIDEGYHYNYYINSIPTAVLSSTNGIKAHKLKLNEVGHTEPFNKKYVYEYKINESATIPSGYPSADKPIYKYTDVSYSTSSLQFNVLSNSSNFKSYAGWEVNGVSQAAGDAAKVHMELLALSNGESLVGNFQVGNYMKLNKFSDTDDPCIYANKGLVNQHYKLVPQQYYVCRVRARAGNWKNDEVENSIVNSFHPPVTAITNLPNLWVDIKYKNTIPGEEEDTVKYITATNSSSGKGINLIERPSGQSFELDRRTDFKLYGFPVGSEVRPQCTDKDNYNVVDDKAYYTAILKFVPDERYAGKDLYVCLEQDKVGRDSYASPWVIEDVQFFELRLDNENKIIYPDDTPKSNTIIEDKFYYLDNENKPVYINGITEGDNPPLIKKYPDTYEAVRHLDIKQSNYFNILTSLAEVFEMWIKFKIYHNEDGSIMLDDEDQPIKEVIFSKYSPTDVVNWAGFKYGVNLKNVQRTIDSNQIATKVIVKESSNEYAKDGICAIQYANDNPTKGNIVYNFTYFMNKGLLKYSEASAALDSYYQNIRDKNDILLKKNKELVELETQLQKVNADIDYANTAEQSSESDIQTLQDNMNWYKDHMGEDNHYYISAYFAYTSAKSLISNFSSKKAELVLTKENILKDIYGDEASGKIGIIKEIENTQREAQEIENTFRSYFSKYILEATWNDDKYIDSNLYYYDALKVSNQNAFPKLTYNFSVIDLGGLEEYAAYKFNIGERTYIEDAEFFGYDKIKIPNDATGHYYKKPFKKEVVISERYRVFDQPDKSMITIKTYKNEFDELFQKVTASVQNLQYASGGYERAARIIESDETIDINAFQKTLEQNAFNISSATNQNVVWDSGRGIEVSDPAEDSRILINSRGVLLSKDGGENWAAAISADGINTSYLSAGQIDAGKINIVSAGGDLAFSWDENGLNAYNEASSEETGPEGGYVRFCKYGLYGMRKGSNVDAALTSATEVMEDAAFALTWEGIRFNDANGNEVFTIDSNTGDLFTKGEIEATKGKIGGLTLEEDALMAGSETGTAFIKIGPHEVTTPSGNEERWISVRKKVNDSYVDQFYVKSDGTVVATGISADSIETPYFKADGYDVWIGGNSSGWKVEENKIVNKDSSSDTVIYKAGISVDSSTPAIWVGNNGNELTSSPFYVTQAGGLYATSANISGNSQIGNISIKNDLLTLGSTESGYANMTIGSDGNYWMQVKDSSGNTKFSIKNDGTVTAAGISADSISANNITAGTIGSKLTNGQSITIGGSDGLEIKKTDNGYSIWLTDWVIQNRQICGSVEVAPIPPTPYGIGLKLPNNDGSNIDTTIGIAIGKNVTTNSSTWSHAPFYVTHDGTLHATGAEISGRIKAGSYLGESPNIIIGTDMTGTNPSYSTGIYSSFNNWNRIGLQNSLLNNEWSGSRIIISASSNGNLYNRIDLESYKSASLSDTMNLYSDSGHFHGTWDTEAAFSITSDFNLKNSIASSTPLYSSFFDNLIPRTYKYNDGTSDRTHYGFIAQEVYSAMEMAGLDLQDFAGLTIDYDEDGNEQTWRLRYDEFIALNTDQIQKLKRRVADLESQIAELQNLLSN